MAKALIDSTTTTEIRPLTRIAYGFVRGARCHPGPAGGAGQHLSGIACPVVEARRSAHREDVMERIEAWSGYLGIVFDGQVVEVFGEPAASSHFCRHRFHLRELRFISKGPDRRGRMNLTLRSEAGGVNTSVSVEGADWPAFEQLVSHVEQRRASLG